MNLNKKRRTNKKAERVIKENIKNIKHGLTFKPKRDATGNKK